MDYRKVKEKFVSELNKNWFAEEGRQVILSTTQILICGMALFIGRVLLSSGVEDDVYVVAGFTAIFGVLGLEILKKIKNNIPLVSLGMILFGLYNGMDWILAIFGFGIVVHIIYLEIFKKKVSGEMT